jgi:hypothetical protein
MSTPLPLFYQDPVVLNKVIHADWCVEEKGGFSYAKQAHAIRLNLEEFSLAAAHYPILFAHEANSWFAVALTGVRTNQNLFVSEEGTWARQAYIPAYVRRYPFIPAQTETNALLVCLDQAYPGVNQNGRGQALFHDQEMTDYAKHVAAFLENYESQSKLTSNYIEELNKLALFKQVDANLTLPGQSGTKLTIQGFFVVDREKLNNLTDEVLAHLVRKAMIDQIVIHLQSLQAFHGLMARAADKE